MDSKEADASLPSFADLLAGLDAEEEEENRNSKLVMHESARDAQSQAASYSVEQLLWQGSADVARAVALFGPGIVVLPLFGTVEGVEGKHHLTYKEHPEKSSNGVMDHEGLEVKFGAVDPQRLIEELQAGERRLGERLKGMSDDAINEEIGFLQEWRKKANGRMKTLEKRAAWAVLGIPQTRDQGAIRRAFKKKALELHPDKGGDPDRFQLLQEMKDLLIDPEPKEAVADEEEAPEEDAAARDAEAAAKAAGREHSSDEGEGSGDDASDEHGEPGEDGSKDKSAEGAQDGGAHGNDRPNLEAARKKLHRNMVATWKRATKLGVEIRCVSNSNGSENAVRTLRRYVDRFVAAEISKLKENDVKRADRILRRFLEQGSEIICAAGVVDHMTTASEVAMKVNSQLLSKASSPDLQRRCSNLLDAIKEMPHTYDRFVGPVELKLAGTTRKTPKDTPAASLPVSPQAHPAGRISAKGGLLEARAAEEPLAAAPQPPAQVALERSFEASFPSQKQTPRVPDDPDALTKSVFAAATQAAEAAMGHVDSQQPEQASAESASLEEQRIRRFAEERQREAEARKNAEDARRKADEANAQSLAMTEQASKEVQVHHQRPDTAANLAGIDLDELLAARLEECAEDDAEAVLLSEAHVRSRSFSLATIEEATPRSKAVQRLRSSWEEDWEHSCAGPKRADGSAIFCDPCQVWVSVAPFEHHDFELHCEEAGHTDWID